MPWKMKNVNDMQSAEWKMKYYEVTFKVISSPAQLDNVNEQEKKKHKKVKEMAATVLLHL